MLRYVITSRDRGGKGGGGVVWNSDVVCQADERNFFLLLFSHCYRTSRFQVKVSTNDFIGVKVLAY